MFSLWRKARRENSAASRLLGSTSLRFALHGWQRAIETKLAELLARYEAHKDEQGRRAVVRNGYLPEREILTGVGPVPVKVPKVRSRTGEPVVFRSSLVPPYVRKAKRVEAALPWLYLKGIATGQMQEALEVLVGPRQKAYPHR